MPPPGLRFRLVGYVSQSAIYCNNRDGVWHYSVSNGEYSDQWFTLLYDVKTHPGRYAIKNEDTGRVLFCRTTAPTTGSIGGDGQYDDKLVPLSLVGGSLVSAI